MSKYQITYKREISVVLLLFFILTLVFLYAGVLSILLEMTIMLFLTTVVVMVCLSGLLNSLSDDKINVLQEQANKIYIGTVYSVTLIFFHRSKIVESFTESVDKDSLTALVVIPFIFFLSIQATRLFTFGISILLVLPFIVIFGFSVATVKQLIIYAMFFIFTGIIRSYKDSQ